MRSRTGWPTAQLPIFQPAGTKPKLKKKNYETVMGLLQSVPPIYHQYKIGCSKATATEVTTPVLEKEREP